MLGVLLYIISLLFSPGITFVYSEYMHREVYGNVDVRSIRETGLDVLRDVGCSELTATVESSSSIKCQNRCSQQA